MAHAECRTLNSEKLTPVLVTPKELLDFIRTTIFAQYCGTAPVNPDTHQCSHLTEEGAMCRYSFARAFETVDLALCQVEISHGSDKTPCFEKVLCDEPRPGVSDSIEW